MEVIPCCWARMENVFAGLSTLAECRALYAEGRFGVIPEMYVRRTGGHKAWAAVGGRAKRMARSNGWARLESPRLRCRSSSGPWRFMSGRFSISGGRKMKLSL